MVCLSVFYWIGEVVDCFCQCTVELVVEAGTYFLYVRERSLIDVVITLIKWRCKLQWSWNATINCCRDAALNAVETRPLIAVKTQLLIVFIRFAFELQDLINFLSLEFRRELYVNLAFQQFDAGLMLSLVLNILTCFYLCEINPRVFSFCRPRLYWRCWLHCLIQSVEDSCIHWSQQETTISFDQQPFMKS